MEINQLCEFIRRVVADKAPTANVTITMERGPRYTRVVSSKWGQRSAYCFVDNATGDILSGSGAVDDCRIVFRDDDATSLAEHLKTDLI